MSKKDLDLPYQTHVLDNGLRVLTIPMPASKIIYYEFQILAGLFYESDAEIESAHFLEHLNGQLTSKKYPNARQNSIMLGQHGIQRNAYVSNYLASYHLYGQKKYSDLMFDIIAHTYSDFVIDKSVFQQERNSIIEELENQVIQPWSRLQEKVNQTLFPKHPASRTRKMALSNVHKLTPETLLEFRRRLYVPDRTLLIIAGDMNQSAMLRLAKSLAKINPVVSVESEPAFIWPQSDAKVTFVKNANLNGQDSVQLALVWRVPLLASSTERFALSLLCHYLSNGLGSQLMIKLRSELGLIYSLNCSLELDPQNNQLSYFTISTNTQGNHVPLVCKTILGEIERLRRNRLTAKEFLAVSNEIQMELLEQAFNHNPKKYTDQYSNQLLWDQPIQSFDEIYQQYQSVDANQLRRVVGEFLNPKNALLVYSAKQKLKNVNNLL